METIRTATIPGPIVELDLSGPSPQVLVDHEPLQGVSRAVVEVDAGEVPVLVLRLIRFDVKGGALPNDMPLFSRKENG